MKFAFAAAPVPTLSPITQNQKQKNIQFTITALEIIAKAVILKMDRR
jgi:hypothetical protein